MMKIFSFTKTVYQAVPHMSNNTTKQVKK